MRAWILRWICGRPVILRWDFSLLGSGFWKWSVQPWAFLIVTIGFPPNWGTGGLTLRGRHNNNWGN